MHTPEKLPENKRGTGGGAAKAPRSSVMSPAAAARGPMTPGAALALQRAVGNQAVSRVLAQEEHVHGAGCGHGAVQRAENAETVEAPAQTLDAALASASRPIESGTLKKAQSFYQNDRLSQGRVHTGPLAQRATAAFGAKALTVGTHILFADGAEHDPATAGHEIGHLDKNLRGIRETGTNHGSVTVTDPNQGSEREAAIDGDAFAQGAEVAPSLAAQQAGGRQAAAGQDTATGAEAASDTTLQRATVQRARDSDRRRSISPREEDERRRRHRSRDYDDRRASTSYASSSRGSTPGYDDFYGDTDYDRYDINYVTDETQRQNPPGRRAVDQNAVMGYPARDILTDAGRPPRGTAAHLHTGAAYALGDGVYGQTQRASNLTPGSHATNLDHKRWEDSVPEVTSMLGVTVTGAGLTGRGASGRGHQVYDDMRFEVRGEDGTPVVRSPSLHLHDYDNAAARRSRPNYPTTQEIRTRMRYGAADQVMNSVPEEDWDSDYREHRRRRRH
ncbi:hypothetical protein ABH935_003744 [Catenulispora sp. GAS73]|uniref:eCIS core domain-containing protein n=1 Tax=Catenulispora sp. GAS73 TaxID=3156269 RepID=UPI003517973A